MINSLEIEAKGLTSQLGKAEHDIQQAVQNLEKAFAAANEQARESGAQTLPDPINLIKRITSLEIALGSLRDDCATIATKRLQIVQKIVASQCKTVSQVKELLERTDDEDPYSSRDEIIDESWDKLTRSLDKQMGLLHAKEGRAAAIN